MSQKVYRAPTITQAVGRVKKDLGPEAVILSTRKRRKGGVFGIGGRVLWEVEAAGRDNRHGENVSSGRYVPQEPHAGSIYREVTSIKSMVESLLAGNEAAPKVPYELRQLHEELVGRDVNPDIAAMLLGRLHEDIGSGNVHREDVVRGRLIDLVAEMIPIAPAENDNGDEPRKIALVGPTGVGKTTTIAKLAAGITINQNKRVGLIAADTYRIAAVDQLKTYAHIIDAPVKTAMNPQQIKQAVDEFDSVDVVLIDTIGRSQNDRLHLNELREILGGAGADEVHLVISASASSSCACSAVEKFDPLGVNRIILSKLDEAVKFGIVLDVVSKGSVPVSYITTGQEVPEDILPADAYRLARCVVEEQSYELG